MNDIDLASEGGRHVPGTPYEWSHGWVPLNAAAKVEKAKYLAAHRAWVKKVESHHTQFQGHHGVAQTSKHPQGGFEARVMRTNRLGKTLKPTSKRFKTEAEAKAHASHAIGSHTELKPRKPQLGHFVSGENLKAARKAMAEHKAKSASHPDIAKMESAKVGTKYRVTTEVHNAKGERVGRGHHIYTKAASGRWHKGTIDTKGSTPAEIHANADKAHGGSARSLDGKKTGNTIKVGERAFGDAPGPFANGATLPGGKPKVDLTSKMDLASPQSMIDKHAVGQDHFKIGKSINGDELVSHTKRVHAQAVAHEREINRTVKSAAASTGGTVKGFKFRLKGIGSTLRKVHSDAVNDKVSPAEAAKNLKDLNRYTITYHKENYAAQTKALLTELRRSGRTVKVKNFHEINKETGGYKGIHFQITNADGHPWELQVHHPEGLHYKEVKSHPLYMEARAQGTSPARVKEIAAQTNAGWDRVPMPANADKLKSGTYGPTSRK